MLFNQKVERRSTVPGRVTKGWQEAMSGTQDLQAASGLPCPTATVSRKLGNPTNLRPLRT